MSHDHTPSTEKRETEDRRFPTPWASYSYANWTYIRASTGFPVVQTPCSPEADINVSKIVRSVNTLGPHLDDAERMRVFNAIAGMDADTFGVFLDRMKEVGFFGGNT